MATMTPNRRPVKPATEDASGTARMTIEIKGTAYRVRPVAAGPDGERAYILRNLLNEQRYCVSQDVTGYRRCECGDFEFRRSGTGTACKHIAALQRFGLLAAPRRSAWLRDEDFIDDEEGGVQ